MTLAPRNWAYAIFLWLSLATVLAPALDPVGSPLWPTEGSAFNAFTSDVSLGPSRADGPQKPRAFRTAPGDGDDPTLASAIAVLPSFPPPAAPRAAAGTIYAAADEPAPARFAGHGFQARAPPSPATL